MNIKTLISHLPRYILCACNIIMFKIKNVHIGTHPRIFGKVGLVNEGSTRIGNNFVCLSGNMSNPMGRNIRTFINVDKTGTLEIKNHVGVSSCVIWCAENIIIEDHVMIGADTIIADTDVHSLSSHQRISLETDGSNALTKPIIIKKNAFIGVRSLILKGVIIGENSIIGGGSVVSCSVPPNQIWAGNPAKFIRNI